MIDEKRIRIAKENFQRYLDEGLIKKYGNEIVKAMYLKNSDVSIRVAEKLINDELQPFLWVIVCSYYSMFYMANAILLNIGYKTTGRNVHVVTSDALITLVREGLKRGLLEEYEQIRDDAMEIASAKADNIIESYDHERTKRSRFQYQMDDEVKKQKAKTSLERAKEFTFELRKML